MKRRLKAAFLCAVLAFSAISAGAMVPGIKSIDEIPDNIVLLPGSSRTFSVGLPVEVNVDDSSEVIKLSGEALAEGSYRLEDELTIETANNGTANMDIKLWGFIPVKSVSVTVGERRVVAGGQSIGVMLYTQGALVVGGSDIITDGGAKVNPAKEAGLKSGDIIQAVDGVEIQNADHLSSIINDESEKTLTLTISRNGELKDVYITPVKDSDDGKYRLGVWVRDSTAGVGTLTFYDPSTNSFAGLGHAITDIDTGSLLSVKEGDIVESDIIDISKGVSGEPGELKGSFSPAQEKLGAIEKNTDYGLYGSAYEGAFQSKDTVEVASRSEVCVGDAVLRCTIDDGGVKEYKCKIVKVNRQNSPGQKSFVVEITDEELLERTGGIVQGMSGSPVLQNGKLVGAVTHVFINDPTKGYGLYADWMLDEINS